MTANAFKHVSVDDIDSPIITRPYNEGHAKSLMPSIKAEGLHQPIKVFQKGGRFILGPGMHRLMAIRMLGEKDIAAVVETYESDEQVRAAQRAENILRENMDPMEEALAIEQSVVDNDDNEQAAADQLGRPLVYIQQRLALLALTPESREALVNKQITLRHAQLLAKIGDAKEQNDLLERCAGSGFADMAGPDHKENKEYAPPMSTEDLAEWVRNRQRDLVKDASWDLSVAFGTHNRDCTGCPFNSKNRPELFVDAGKAAMTCGDGACFDEKRTITGRRTRSVAWQLAKTGVNGVPMTKKNCKSVTPKHVAEVALEKDSTFVTAKAVKAALPAIIEQQAPNQGGKKGSSKENRKAEQSGSTRRNDYMSPDNVRKRGIQEKLGDATTDWKNRLLVQAATAMSKNPLACGYLVLLNHHHLWHKAENNRLPSDDRKKFIALLAVTPKATADDLARMARTIELPKVSRSSRRTVIPDMLDGAARSFSTWSTHGDVLVACFTEAFKLDTQVVGEKPTYQVIEQKHFPKPKEEKKPEAAKPKPKANKAKDGVGTLRRAAKQAKKKAKSVS